MADQGRRQYESDVSEAVWKQQQDALMQQQQRLNQHTGAPSSERNTIADALNEQERVIGDLHALVCKVSELLATVVRTLPPVPTGPLASGNSAPKSSGVLNRIQANNRLLLHGMEHLAELMTRLEL